MKERPILFSAPMVRAILEGRKTQTRRVVKLPPKEWGCDGEIMASGLTDHVGAWVFDSKEDWESAYRRCPYGKPGDRLWVREAWKTGSELNEWNASEITAKCLDAGYKSPGAPTLYIADSTTRAWGDMDKEDFGDWGRYRHPRFMPRWASRILLEITEVRVQRLQEISEEDAMAEGVEPLSMTEEDIADTQISDCSPDEKELARLMGPGSFSHKFTYQMLWDEINGARSWDTNPWCWAITFKVVQP